MEEHGETSYIGLIDGHSSNKEVAIRMPTPEDIQKFIMSLFENWTEGSLGVPGQCSVSLDSRRKDFFPAKDYMCSLKIGIDIDEKFFGFDRSVCFAWAMPNHAFHFNSRQVGSAFYEKYKKEKISDQTMKEFSEMVYDLILIKNGLPFC